eukprot:TRINITY_DN1225_c0_g3_i1.p1 TRINITY_DN1225_c0_g3~~TRINITY_DN1225_c0_g3_i1.p1  ORF type:complete len:457 (+),score=124.08 TRINITY_DN1225_c0_g3_i1:133-1503(+)
MASLLRQILGVSLGAAITFWAGGIIYGYNALLPILIREGVYSSLCETPYDDTTGCADQLLRLNLLYTIGVSCLYFMVILFGYQMDKLGAQFTMVTGVCVVAAGSVCAALGSVGSSSDTDIFWDIALISWGVASPAIFMTALSLPKLFPKHHASVTSVIVCSFDTSTGVMLLFQVLYINAGIPFSWIATGHAIITLFVGLACAFLLPTISDVGQIDAEFDNKVEDAVSSRRSSSRRLPADETFLLDHRASEPLPVEEAEVVGWSSFLCAVSFWLAAIYIAVFSLKNAFFLGTFAAQINYISPSSTSTSFTNFVLNLGLPIGGVLTGGLGAVILTWLRDDAVFFLVLTLGLAHAVLNMVPLIWPQYVAIAIFAVLRPLKWASFSAYMISSFPLAIMGSAFGVANIVVGVLNLLVFVFTYVTEHHFGGNFLFANATLTVMEAAMVVFPLYLFFKHRSAA